MYLFVLIKWLEKIPYNAKYINKSINQKQINIS